MRSENVPAMSKSPLKSMATQAKRTAHGFSPSRWHVQHLSVQPIHQLNMSIYLHTVLTPYNVRMRTYLEYVHIRIYLEYTGIPFCEAIWWEFIPNKPSASCILSILMLFCIPQLKIVQGCCRLEDRPLKGLCPHTDINIGWTILAHMRCKLAWIPPCATYNYFILMPFCIFLPQTQ